MAGRLLIRFTLVLLMSMQGWAQDDYLLRLSAVTGRLHFPDPLRLPDILRAEEAPGFVVEDYREQSSGYTIWLQLSNFQTSIPSYSVSLCAQPLLNFRSLDAAYSVEPEQIALPISQTFDQPVMVARANRVSNPLQGRGRWQCTIFSQALQIRVPLTSRPGLNQAQLHISLRPS